MTSAETMGAKVDPRFDFDMHAKDWRKDVGKQPMLGSTFRYINPKEKLDQPYDALTFELPDDCTIVPGTKTRFHIEGKFERYDPTSDSWTAVPSGDAANVMVAQNWFEKLITRFDVQNEYQTVTKLNNEPEGIDAYYNAFLYSHMAKELKNLLCLEPSHTGNAVGLTHDEWDFAGKAWLDYSKSIFKEGTFSFGWIPLNIWPFYQGGGFVLDKKNPVKAVPLQLHSKTKVNIQLVNDFGCIFRKKAAEPVAEGEAAAPEYGYRFKLTKVVLGLEVAALNLNFAKALDRPRKQRDNYLANAKRVDWEKVTGNIYEYKMERVKFPNSLVLFAQSRDIVSGKAKFQDTKEGFLKHRIKYVKVMFNNVEIFKSESPGPYESMDLFNRDLLYKHVYTPIGNIPVDKEKLTYQMVADDGTSYAFPHFYLVLSPNGPRQMLLPANGDWQKVLGQGEMRIIVTLEDGATLPDNYILFYCALYNDVDLQFDRKSRKFTNEELN